MPAPVAPFIGFCLGVAFAWAAAGELGRATGSGATSRSLVVVSWFGLLVFAPVAAYFMAFNPDWSFAYLIDTQRLPAAVDLALVLVDAASVPVGFLAAARAASVHRLGGVVRFAAAPALAPVLFVGLCFRRLSVQATFAQYHGDFGQRAVAGGSLGYSLLWMSAVLTAGVWWTTRSLRRIGQGSRRN
ncbi:MAG: hypothetical protein OZ921_03795 [Sorangiineae bacterium]|nr:hypothetical protein [Polyangiaceae bacterium]MEB2321613.1 hypothetical protein [Sorangiineae bacterium]